MTHTNSHRETRRERKAARAIHPVRVEVTNEEILADLLYPVGRDTIRARVGRLS